MMHCIPVRHFFSILLFAAAALPAHAATVAEAVSAARATDPVDVDGIVAHPDGVLDAVGGGSTEGLDDVQSLWADGKGTLAGSAQASVIECRGKTDTTCRAIQVLDRGFPERPSIGEDILAGRDEIVENPTTTPNAGEETCRDVSIETPEVETTETCRAGGWWTETACRIGPVEIGKDGQALRLRRRGRQNGSEKLPLADVGHALNFRLDPAVLLRAGSGEARGHRQNGNERGCEGRLHGHVHVDRRLLRNRQVQRSPRIEQRPRVRP